MSDKITNRFNIHLFALAIFSTVPLPPLYAQENTQPQVIKKYTNYKQSIRKDSLKKMIELKTIVPDIQYELRYATINNFMHRKLYKNANVTFLRLPVARALAKVQQELNKKGLSLKIWDAYRPYSGFDNVSDTAHHDFMNLPAETLKNRSLLKTEMERHGFKGLDTEWWHFYWNSTEFELLDIDPKKFEKKLN